MQQRIFTDLLITAVLALFLWASLAPESAGRRAHEVYSGWKAGWSQVKED